MNRIYPENLVNPVILSKLDVAPDALLSYPVCNRGSRAAYRK